MKNVLKEALEHSIINRYAWVMVKDGSVFYTDSEEIYSHYATIGYKCTAEFYKGEKTEQTTPTGGKRI